MEIYRTPFDRRSTIQRRQTMSTSCLERRKGERRISGERREFWVRFSKWNSVNLDLKNRYLWATFN